MNNMIASMKTAAGELRCYKNSDATFPGFSICLVPNGTDFEIDVAMVEVPEDKDYRDSFNITEGDLMAYLWGNVYDEDYTVKTTLRKADVEDMIKENM